MTFVPFGSLETRGTSPIESDIERVQRRRVHLLALAVGAGLFASEKGDAAPSERGKSGRNGILGGGGLHHITVRTNDWDRTVRFYEQVLGFTTLMSWNEHAGTMDERLKSTGKDIQRWAYLDSGDGNFVEIFEDFSFVPPPSGTTDPTKNPGSPLVHFGVRTSQVDKVCARARSLGATVLADPVDYTINPTTGGRPVVMRLTFLQGPNGEWIELLQNGP
jgi:glyoxylase I family protein